jgi:hypothetical protein
VDRKSGDIMTMKKLGVWNKRGKIKIKEYKRIPQLVALAIKNNLRTRKQLGVIGLVIVECGSGKPLQVAQGQEINPYVRRAPRVKSTTIWLRYVNEDEEVFKIQEGTHRIGKRITNEEKEEISGYMKD